SVRALKLPRVPIRGSQPPPLKLMLGRTLAPATGVPEESTTRPEIELACERVRVNSVSPSLVRSTVWALPAKYPLAPAPREKVPSANPFTSNLPSGPVFPDLTTLLLGPLTCITKET